MAVTEGPEASTSDSKDCVMDVDMPGDKPGAALAGGDGDHLPVLPAGTAAGDKSGEARDAEIHTVESAPDVEMSKVSESDADKPDHVLQDADNEIPLKEATAETHSKDPTAEAPSKETAVSAGSDESNKPEGKPEEDKPEEDKSEEGKPEGKPEEGKPEQAAESKTSDKASNKDIDLVTLDSDSDEPASPTKPGGGPSAPVGGGGNASSRQTAPMPRVCLNPDCKARDGLAAAVSSDLVYFTMVHGEDSAVPTQLSAQGKRAKICRVCRMVVEKYNKVGAVPRLTLHFCVHSNFS